jgi:uncharacterized protein (TIGR00661 family)
MKKKEKLIFSLASAGMGHVTRDIPLIQRLNQDYEVHTFCSGQANSWLSQRFSHVHQNHAIKGASVGGKISIGLVVLKAITNLPKSFFYILRMALFILKHRPVAVISDFEAHSVYGALLVRPFVKIPIISCDHWTTIRLSERPFDFTDDEIFQLKKWQKTIKIVGPKADRYLVHKTMETKLSEKNARYVPTPVRDSFLKAGEKISSDGPVVISMGHLAPASLSTILEKSPLSFVIYGSENPRVENNVEYRSFNEDQFIESLQRSPFVIVSANSSAIDALALKKPLLYIPTKGQFEQYYCGKMFEHIGVAKLSSNLSVQVVNEFQNNLGPYQTKAENLDIFDNEALYREIKLAISECS